MTVARIGSFCQRDVSGVRRNRLVAAGHSRHILTIATNSVGRQLVGVNLNFFKVLKRNLIVFSIKGSQCKLND